MMGLPFGIFAGLLFGLRSMRSNINRDIKTFEMLNWSWKNSITWAVIALIIANIFAFLIGLIVPEHRTIFRLLIMLISVAIGTVFGGLRSAIVETDIKSMPNQGIQYSRKSAVLGAIIGGCIGTLIGILRGSNYVYAVQTFSTLGMSMGALWYGGLDLIQHLTLRLILNRNNFMPWNYACFLDYATELNLLQKIGGSYSFIHPLLLEHFAQMELERLRQ